MSVNPRIEAKCKEISTNYSACDVSDALLKLKVPQAGFLPDIVPLNNINQKPRTIVAPLSTALFIPKDPTSSSTPATTGETTPTPTPIIPQESNIPSNKHWTDLPDPGTVVLLQQPGGQICAVCGDILATRLKVRGVRGIVADGRVRDIVALTELCQPRRPSSSSSSTTAARAASDGEEGSGEQPPFTVWSRGTSTVGTGLSAQAWCVNVPLSITNTTTMSSDTTSPPPQINPGDIIVCDEGEKGSVVIPLSKLDEVLKLLPGLKEADEKCIADVEAGVGVREAFRRHR